MEHQAEMHPLASHNLPLFVTVPGETDGLLWAMGIFMLLAVVGIGVLYFKLHALPEHLAHRGQKVQFEIVAVLALLALFTHNHVFWVAALLLAVVPLPDFTTPLTSMAQSLGRMARRSQPAASEGPAVGAIHEAPRAATPILQPAESPPAEQSLPSERRA